MVINKCVEDEWGGKRGSDEAMGRGLGILGSPLDQRERVTPVEFIPIGLN
jgi:hypothetical protein